MTWLTSSCFIRRGMSVDELEGEAAEFEEPALLDDPLDGRRENGRRGEHSWQQQT